MKMPTEMMYGTTIKQQLDLLHTGMKEHNPIKARIEAKDAIAFAQMAQKRYYDRKHYPMFFQLGDYAHTFRQEETRPTRSPKR